MWPTTTENKYFVKMLWHLWGEYVKATVLLVCSICTIHHFFIFYFSQSSICTLFSTIFLHCSYSVFHYSSTVPFWLATLSFFILFFIVLNSSYSTKRHCSYNSYFFFFFGSSVCTFFFPFIYITVHPVFLRCTSTVSFY